MAQYTQKTFAKNSSRRVLSAAALGLCLAVGVGANVPAEAIGIPNRDQTLNIRGEDGRSIYIAKLNERLDTTIPVALNPLAHEGFIDLTGRVKLSKNGPKITSAKLQVGYQVGCMAVIDGVKIGGDREVTLKPSVERSATNKIGGEAKGEGSINPSIEATPSISVKPKVSLKPSAQANAGIEGAGGGVEAEGGVEGEGGIEVTPGLSLELGGNIGGSVERSVTRTLGLGADISHSNSWEATVKPGAITTVIFAELPFTGFTTAGVKLTKLEVNVNSCAGPVSFRSFVRLIYKTKMSIDDVSVYGKTRFI